MIRTRIRANRHAGARLLLGGALLFGAVLACEASPEPIEKVPPPPPPPPIDTMGVTSVDTAAAWGYRHVAEADVDGDGTEERLVLTADVALSRRADPLWEDGHRWAAFVEEPSGERTLVYAAFVPNGFVQAAVLIPDPDGRRPILLQERTPGRVRTLAVDYRGPGAAFARSVLEYNVDEWLIESLPR